MESTSSHSKTESSHIVIMVVMMTGATICEAELASTRVTLERLSQENANKDLHIKRQEEHIAKLPKKLETRPCVSSNKGARSKKNENGSSQNKAFGDNDGSKKGALLLIFKFNDIEQMQRLIANVIKA